MRSRSRAGSTAGATTAVLVFIDLRDWRGIVQVVFNPQVAPDAHEAAQSLRSEWVLRVRGAVGQRPPGT